MLKLYYSPGSCALAAHIALEEAGGDYETVRINFGSEEQRAPEFLAINPKGRVPALVTGKGILTETPAILLFIAQRYPQAGLTPRDDIFELARWVKGAMVDTTKLPKIFAHMERMEARIAVKTALDSQFG